MEDSKLKFEDMGLSPRILSAIDTAGYESPTPIQEQSIPIAMEGADLLGLAQTGTGKTAAFAIPLLEKLLETSGERKANIRGRRPEVLVIGPTRELVDQINESIKQLGIYHHPVLHYLMIMMSNNRLIHLLSLFFLILINP